MVFFTQPMRGDKTLTEALHEIQSLKLENQSLRAKLHIHERNKSMIRALVESFLRTFNQITGKG